MFLSSSAISMFICAIRSVCLPMDTFIGLTVFASVLNLRSSWLFFVIFLGSTGFLGLACTLFPCLFSLQVLVMTAQILLNILRHSIIKMEAINLLILDECHHAVKKHPYSLVMSEFYHTTPKEKRPSVFGMTASPVNLKGSDLVCNF